MPFAVHALRARNRSRSVGYPNHTQRPHHGTRFEMNFSNRPTTDAPSTSRIGSPLDLICDTCLLAGLAPTLERKHAEKKLRVNNIRHDPSI